MFSTSLLPCFHMWPYLGLLDNFPCCFTLIGDAGTTQSQDCSLKASHLPYSPQSVSMQAFVACHTLEDCQMANPHHSYTLHVCTIFLPPNYLLLPPFPEVVLLACPMVTVSSTLLQMRDGTRLLTVAVGRHARLLASG